MAGSRAGPRVVDTVDWGVHRSIAGGRIAWSVARSAAGGSQVAEVRVPDGSFDGIPKNLLSTLKGVGTPFTETLGTLSDWHLFLTQVLLKLIYVIL